MITKECSLQQLLAELSDMRQRLASLQTVADEHERHKVLLEEKAHLLALSSEVGTALAGSDSLRTSLQRCAEALVQHLGVAVACIWTLKPAAYVLELQANAGIYSPLVTLDGFIPVEKSELSFIVEKRQAYVTHTILDDPWFHDKAWVQQTGITTFAGYPLVVEDRLLGVLAMLARDPFDNATLKALTWMASVIAMGIDRMWISDALARSIAKMIRMNKSLRRMNAELDELTYVASSDLQEPLRKLITFSSMLRQDAGGSLPVRAEKDLGFIVDAATQMHVLLQNLLALSRVGNRMMHCTSVALDACADRALEALATPIRATGASITRDVLPTVWGDSTMLTQVYQHLLNNALKFRSARRPLIHLSVEPQTGQSILGVQDNGIGIKPEYHEQIFAPFRRLHGHSECAGAGLGLTICRKTVERHGGRIWVESDAGQGAHFKFTLGEPP
ncbi:MAG TPA: ATP-binding protein [Candidatus Tectomicrobia bacterium]|jgi:signal transduction histidine kinase